MQRFARYEELARFSETVLSASDTSIEKVKNNPNINQTTSIS